MKRTLAYVAITALEPNPANPKEHRLDTIGDSMGRWGYTEPLLLDERTGYLAAGHGRVDALERLQAAGAEPPEGIVVRGGKWLVPVARGWASKDDAEAERYLVASNKLTMIGGWDDERLAEILTEAAATENALVGMGFDDVELVRFLAGLSKNGSSATDPDEAPPAPARAITKTGDLWLLGDHRVACGDSTDPGTITELMAGQKASVVFTDPPYGVSYESEVHGTVEGDDKRRDDLAALLTGAFKQTAAHTDEDAGWYIWHATATRDDFAWAMKEAGLEELQILVWTKLSATLGWSDYRPGYEPCFYAARAGHRPLFYGDRTNETVWRVATVGKAGRAMAIGPGVVVSDGEGHEIMVTTKVPKSRRRHIRATPDSAALLLSTTDTQTTAWEVSRESDLVHATQKPVELATRALRNSSLPGQIVLDSFLGSGSTLIAAHLTDRRCYGAEVDRRLVDVICQRWEAVSGERPVLARTGKARSFQPKG